MSTRSSAPTSLSDIIYVWGGRLIEALKRRLEQRVSCQKMCEAKALRIEVNSGRGKEPAVSL